MTRKRLVKLLMGCGYSRNAALLLVARARNYPSYAEFWRRNRLGYELHAAVQPAIRAIRAIRAIAAAVRAIDWDALAVASRQITNALSRSEESTS